MNSKKFWKKLENEVVFHGEKLNAFDSIERHASDNLALLFDNGKKKQEFSYFELITLTNKFAGLLNYLKVKKGSRVFFFLPKCPELYLGILGTIKQGSVACPLFEAFEKQGLELRLEKGRADILFTNRELAKRLPKDIKKKFPFLKQVVLIDSNEFKKKFEDQKLFFESTLKNPNDPMIMIFTSSTAGTPVAGIEIPHKAIVQQYYTGKLVLKLSRYKTYWCTAHPAWVTGIVYGILSPLSIGAEVFVYEPHFDSKKWINFLVNNKISVLYTAPTVLRLWKNDIKKDDFRNLEVLASVGEVLNEATYNYYHHLGINITNTYWQTETGAMVIASYKKKGPGVLGQAIPGVKARLRKGEIVLEPSFPSLMKGIFRHEQMYSSYFEKKYFKTHDMAKKRFGTFYFEHRKDDVIKTSGERVSPIEIESVLLKDNRVSEAAVIGIPDEVKGAILKAFVVLNKGVKESIELKEELSLFVKKNYAGHSYPKIIEFVKSLPKTNSGKILRSELMNRVK